MAGRKWYCFPHLEQLSYPLPGKLFYSPSRILLFPLSLCHVHSFPQRELGASSLAIKSLLFFFFFEQQLTK